MPISRGLTAVSLSLTLVGAFTLASYAARVHAAPGSRHAAPHPAVRATLIVNGSSRVVTSTALHLSGLLDDAGVTIHPGDDVRPPLNCQTFEGMTVCVNTHATRSAIVRTPVPFATVFRRSTTLLPGRRKVAQAGVSGIKDQQVDVETFGTRELGRRVVKSWWERKPTPKVVLVGTDQFLASRGISGVRRVLTMSATEYDAYLGGAGSGRTCTGIRARRGVVAVDPRVIPLGSRLYVEGYGYCIAADTGGAIKGHRIDLCVPSPAEADRYGRRTVRVIVLD